MDTKVAKCYRQQVETQGRRKWHDDTKASHNKKRNISKKKTTHSRSKSKTEENWTNTVWDQRQKDKAQIKETNQDGSKLSQVEECN